MCEPCGKGIMKTEENFDEKHEELRAIVKELIMDIMENNGKIAPKCTRCLLLLEEIGTLLRVIEKNESEKKLTLPYLRPTKLPMTDKSEEYYIGKFAEDLKEGVLE